MFVRLGFHALKSTRSSLGAKFQLISAAWLVFWSSAPQAVDTSFPLHDATRAAAIVIITGSTVSYGRVSSFQQVIAPWRARNVC
jgi:hypothetical protein